uniref:Uncharacterized protein n=1 Tax=Strigamia maritima TaxID=126957 RepID=T1J774_STRMM
MLKGLVQNMEPWSALTFLMPHLIGTKEAHITIEGALQQYEISKALQCGHPVQLQVSFCICDCDEAKAKNKTYNHGKNNDCNENHVCCLVSSKHLNINGNRCRAYGICRFIFSPIRDYKLVHLKNPKKLNILELNGHNENILVPIKYSSLVVKNEEFRINCMRETDYPIANQPGWYFWSKDEPHKIFKTKYPQTFNEEKEVNVEKYCWYQSGNEDAIVNKTISLQPLTDAVCNGNEYGLNISMKGLRIKAAVPDDDPLLGIKVDASTVTFSTDVAEFYYSCINGNIEYNPHFIPLFERVRCTVKDVYLTINFDARIVRNEVSIAVLDQKGGEITREKSVVLQKFVVLALLKPCSDFLRHKVLVCVDVQSATWCEVVVIKDVSDYFSSTLSPVMTTTVVLKASEKENNSETDLINSTLHDDFDTNIIANTSEPIQVPAEVSLYVLVTIPILLTTAVVGVGVFCWKRQRDRKMKRKVEKNASNLLETVPLTDRELDEHVNSGNRRLNNTDEGKESPQAPSTHQSSNEISQPNPPISTQINITKNTFCCRDL